MGVYVGVEEALRVGEGESLAHRDTDTVRVSEIVSVSVGVPEGVPVSVAVPDADTVTDAVPECEGREVGDGASASVST